MRCVTIGILSALIFFQSFSELPGLADDFARPRWSVVVYAGLDEEEIAKYGNPVTERLLRNPLPEGVELLIQQDSFKSENDFRAIRRDSSPAQRTPMPEIDSASPANFDDFIKWAMANARGEHLIFVVLAHSWGWKGIVQDFTLPDSTDDTMIPLREFARVMNENSFHPEVMLLDACILGNAEAIEELKDTAHYLLTSERETPYSSFPYSRLIEALGNPQIDPFSLARTLPGEYVRAFARDGALAQSEGEYFVTTMAAIDLTKWGRFTGGFKRLVTALKDAGFRKLIEMSPDFGKSMADDDSNVDMVALLQNLSEIYAANTSEPAVIANSLLQSIGYPKAISEKNGEIVTVAPPEAIGVRIEIQADEIMGAGTEEDPNASVLKKIRKTWEAENQDLHMPKGMRFKIAETGTPGQNFRRTLVINVSLHDPFSFRPWLPGTREVRITTTNENGVQKLKTLTREADYFIVSDFPVDSFFVSEAHTFGAPFLHGIGIHLDPLMNENEPRGEDPITGLLGPDFYRIIRWNLETGWGNLTLLN